MKIVSETVIPNPNNMGLAIPVLYEALVLGAKCLTVKRYRRKVATVSHSIIAIFLNLRKWTNAAQTDSYCLLDVILCISCQVSTDSLENSLDKSFLRKSRCEGGASDLNQKSRSCSPPSASDMDWGFGERPWQETEAVGTKFGLANEGPPGSLVL